LSLKQGLLLKTQRNLAIKKIIIVTMTVLLLLAGGFAGAKPPLSKKPAQPAYAEGELLVKYKSGVPAGQRATHVRGLGAAKVKEFRRLHIHHVKLPPGLPVAEGVRMFEQNPNVEYAEPNYILRAEALPDDPRYGEQWGMDKIAAPGAWDIANSAGGVTVAVLDTGVDHTHPDLAPNIWHNPGEICDTGNDDDGNGYVDDCIGWDYVDADNDPMEGDPTGHGTQVAGVLGAAGNNARGVAGAAWKVKIMPLRFLEADGTGLTSDAISSIEYARAKGAGIVNCSWGSAGFSSSLKAAIDASPGLLFVCAAGNGGADGIGDDTDVVSHIPSGFQSPNILSVAATDFSDGLALYSNFGAASVDIGAPGGSVSPPSEKILSTALAPRAGLLAEGFDSTGGILPAGWTSSGSWDLTNAVSDSPQHSLTDSPLGPYAGFSNTAATSPVIPLAGETGCFLFYRMRLDTGPADTLHVEASINPPGGVWNSLSGHGGSTGGEFRTFVDSLKEVEGSDAAIRFRLEAVTGNPGSNDGAYIDDVSVRCLMPPHSEYGFLAGTSFAVPHAAGVAALLMEKTPALTALEAKHIIINTTDPRASLAGKTVSGGRLNAARALGANLGSLPPVSPSGLRAALKAGPSIELTWNDNSPWELGFTVERRASGESGFTGLASLGVDETAFVDTGLAEGLTYTYRVRAFNASGVSPPSEEAAVGIPGGGGGGCFIATAAFGSGLSPEVEALRRFRDERLLTNAPGRLLVRLYYRHSPPLAEFISRRPAVRRAARLVLSPLLHGVRHPLGAASAFILILSAVFYAAGKHKRRRH
jgi:subtilisin family serine protease